MAQQPDPEAVINTLIHTFSADAATRKAAEEGIAQLTSMRGSLFLLVQVAAAPVREDARQAAAITVKNLIFTPPSFNQVLHRNRRGLARVLADRRRRDLDEEE